MTQPLLAARPHHFSISVPDMEAAIGFWESVFGFVAEHRFAVAAIGGEGCFMRLGGMKIELWRLAGAAPVPQSRRAPNTDLLTNGTKHVGFTVPDLQAALDRLHPEGVAIVAVQRHPSLPMKAEADPTSAADPDRPKAFAAFIADPFGTLIEVLDGPSVGAELGG